MALDAWLRDDVTRILTSAADGGRETIAALAVSSPEAARTYQAGHDAALRVVALAFGIALPQNDKVYGGEWIPAQPVIECVYRTGEEPD